MTAAESPARRAREAGREARAAAVARRRWTHGTPLTRAELAELYRLTVPPGDNTPYLGDPPEKWTRATLLRQLRNRLTETREGRP